ncbi:ribosome biogenesis protein BRX1 homolog [Mercenaria mercenaria]|uniref:ribosome biogenesis protein BRX1 homolog n=1 Tax=Mercenaria mercenaria TaxID=6596 RepID=UPI001E1D97F0|nr:ribosome biogenesis protein BRX1 homolog [Mercenaria mercenaria]
MGKRKHKEISTNSDRVSSKKDDNEVVLEPVVNSDEPPIKQTKWTNKQRVLIFSSRGISHRARHLMIDLRTMMPHSKSESKMDRKDKLFVINEVCEMKNCNKCIFFEAKKKMDLYMWASNCPRGPSVKFLVENVHTMSELKMTGNCLKGSRPLLSFDKAFDEEPHWSLMKELFTQIFGTPNHHPKSQPFFDHVFTFSISDNRIWFRNYQILEEDGSLAEIGPRFVLNPIRIFEGSFGGATLYQNPKYVSPNLHRRLLRRQVAQKYVNRVQSKKSLEERKPEFTYTSDVTDDVFVTIQPEDSKQNG